MSGACGTLAVCFTSDAVRYVAISGWNLPKSWVRYLLLV